MNITFIKLGGSLITDKSKPYTARLELISQLFKEIKKISDKNPNVHFIIGHGAGSFAHTSAHKYKTIDGLNSENDKFGAAFVHTDALKLHQIVLEEGIKQQLPLFSVQPSSFMLTVNKKVKQCNSSIIIELLKQNMIPLVFGDVIIDTKIGATIYSTDSIFTTIIQSIRKKISLSNISIIHAGNYDGVLDMNQNVIKQITPESFLFQKESIGKSEQLDVTGGMIAKVTESVLLAKKGITSYIINGNTTGNLSKIFSSKSIGTEIVGNK